ncbi:MAG: MFS transporter [Pseudomonadota bacterium]|nr:MFS transporter [Pseudomonadota bacterium]QKK04564.1 MAG: MFS transporter [Pseudomonadota bacterium]
MKHATRLLIGSFKNISALLLGIALLQVASGLQGTLIGLRAAIEDFSTMMIGVFMSMYYAGFLAGARYAPRIIGGIGHPRMFAAMASISSITILFHFISIDPYVWMVMRAVNGFAFAGLFVAAESWLNDMARPRVRGQVVAIYMTIQYLFLAFGYNLVNMAQPTEAFLYILVSILISAALLPVLLTTRKTPHFSTPELFPIKKLFDTSRLSAIGAINMGLTHSIMFTMGVIYLQRIGLATADITLLLSTFILAGALSQWPAGALSDRGDRRVVICGLSFLSAVSIAGVGWFVETDRLIAAVFMAAYGVFFLPLYAMILAYMNDKLKPSQMVSASATLYIFYGVSSVIGPLLCAFVMNVYGMQSFPVSLSVLHLLFGLYSIWRITISEAVPSAEQGTYLPAMRMPVGVTPLLKTMIKTAQESMTPKIKRKTAANITEEKTAQKSKKSTR